MSATVTTKGQVTIPKSVRDHLGIVPGSQVDFRRTADGQILIEPAEAKPSSRFAKLLGHAGAGMTTEELMALTRAEP
ncbi:MAG: AbrB/MazE/SpoVT family DNA-binding domain-containing protein [Devosia sp.]|uniref:AbrB/MazE/SpoVT family DNA-binding domain-containing protein n=1 Tax=Devosia sp. TaxID=1871048 RepID=UPI003393122B